MRSGRQREASEIVRYKKAAQVGRLLLGELNGPMELISIGQYLDRPRRQLLSERNSLRASLRAEIGRFCQTNFENVDPEDLAKLYDRLFSHGSEYFLPRAEFEREFGQFKPHVLKGAPSHSTIHISPWGLQTEFPEAELVKEMAISLNEAIGIENNLEPFKAKSWRERKDEQTRIEIANLIRRREASQRACILSCFNLVEAYVNGLAWGYVQTHDISKLSKDNRNVLTESERPANIVTKLIKVPALTAERDSGPLHQTRDPLKSFIEVVKPYRDAIVHASPFDAPEKFGGYSKLSKLYGLKLGTVREAVEVTVALIRAIHQFVDGTSDLPSWFPPRTEDGRFVLVPEATKTH